MDDGRLVRLVGASLLESPTKLERRGDREGLAGHRSSPVGAVRFARAARAP